MIYIPLKSLWKTSKESNAMMTTVYDREEKEFWVIKKIKM